MFKYKFTIDRCCAVCFVDPVSKIPSPLLLSCVLVFATVTYASGQSDSRGMARIAIRSNPITVSKPLVTVGDVAEVRGTDSRLIKAIAELDLEMIDQENEPVRIGRSQIEMRIRVSEVKEADFRVSGPSAVVVTRVPKNEPIAKIKERIVTGIAHQFALDAADIRVAIEASEDSLNWGTLAEQASSAFVVLPNNLPLGKTPIQLKILDEAGRDQAVTIECDVTLMVEMLVAKRTIPRGNSLNPDDFALVKRPLQSRTFYPASRQQIVGQAAAKSIAIHDIVRVSDLVDATTKTVVRRDDIVDVLYRRGGLNLRIKNVKVLSAGAIGDRVEVLNPDSNKRLIASVVNESLVEVR